MTGSWFLLREETKAKALDRLSKDVYVTGGAWDMSKVSRSPPHALMQISVFLFVCRETDALVSSLRRPPSKPSLSPSTKLQKYDS